MQNYRLFKIMYLLMDKKRITAKELSNVFEVSTRTIYRDIDVLSMAGIPIYADRGQGGGISLMEHFKLSRALLSEIEQEAILTGISSVSMPESVTGDKHSQKTLTTKLQALFQKDDMPVVRIDANTWCVNNREQHNATIFKQAIQSQQAMHITYVDNKGEKSKRDIYPLQLLFKGSAWYLTCFCLLRQSIRLLKLQRIIALEERDGYFTRADYAHLMQQAEKEQKPHGDIPYIEVIITLKSQALTKLYDYFDDEEIITLPDGNIQVKSNMPDEDWIYGCLIYLYPHILSIKPDIVLQKTQNFLQERYKYFSNMT